ncbi:MAG: hypothetical protein ACI8UO_006756 [Verrucomicrobiales bacterium]|jgi:hypothetical protein
MKAPQKSPPRFVLSPIFLLLIVLAFTGCAELSWMNPVLVLREWPEDDRYIVPFHQRVEEIRRIGYGAEQYSPEEQLSVATQLTDLIRESKNPLLRATATRSLGRFPSSLASTGIGLAMVDEDWAVRVSATEACRWQADEAAQQRLVAMLKDESVDVQIAAIRELSNFPGGTTITALGEFLDHTDPAVQIRAIDSLRTVSGRDYGNNFALWRSFVRGENPATPPKGSIVSRARSFF